MVNDGQLKDQMDGYLFPASQVGAEVLSLPAEVDEKSAVILRVLLNAVVERLDIRLLEEAQDAPFQLTAPLPWDDLHTRGLDPRCFGQHRAKRAINVLAAIEDVMEIKRQLRDANLLESLSAPSPDLTPSTTLSLTLTLPREPDRVAPGVSSQIGSIE